MVRLKVPRQHEVRFEDIIRGWVVVHSSNIDDKVLFKSDGWPTYHLANIVDDHTMAAATVGALLIAKVVLIADKLPIINRFPEKPLIYNVVWKTVIYIGASLLLHYLEHLVPTWWHMTASQAERARDITEGRVLPGATSCRNFVATILSGAVTFVRPPTGDGDGHWPMS